ncbi:MAG: hypothetical protein IKN54_00680 [Lachnospiraceae bacterium]|nr:hypothetical protein [Lachnospiraceae bacterium]
MNQHEVTKTELSITTDKLLHEITTLKTQLEYETKKHKQWKELAMTFHDSLWSLVEEYVLPQQH